MSKTTKINLSESAQSFLWYSYFSESYESVCEDTSKALNICANRAYRDLCITLSFSKEHPDFCSKGCELLQNKISEKILNCEKSYFDKNHNEICDAIVKACNDKKVLEKDFTYGQAQKWLNMTLKYMLIMGFWNDELKDIIGVMHVPVDSYVIEAVWKDEHIILPMKSNKTRGKYNSEKVVPWSKWDKDMYTAFQTSLRESEILNGEVPINWERHAWLNIAENRSQRIPTKEMNKK